MPPELKALKNKAEKKKNHLEAALDSLKASLPQMNKDSKKSESKKSKKIVKKNSFDEDKSKEATNINFSISLTTKMEEEPEPSPEKEEVDDSKPSVSNVSKSPVHRQDRDDQSQTEYQRNKLEKSKAHNREVFFALLKEKKIDAMMKWNHVDRLLRNEKRYKLITKISEKKKLFNEYIAMNKRAERNLARSKLEKARNEFIEMLKDFENLTSDSKWSYCVQYFYMDPRYQAVEEKDRENLFQDYLDELWEKEKRKARDEREEMIERMKEHFEEITLIKVSTTWDEACDLLKYNPVWQKMNDLDRLESFSDYILGLNKTEEDARRK